MFLMTPQEYVNRSCPEVAFFYMPDLVNYIFNHSPKDSKFGGCSGAAERTQFHKESLREEMVKGTHDAEDLDKQAESFERKKTHRERDSDSGTFDVERYLEGDERPFTDVFTEKVSKVSKTIFLELSCSWSERNDTETYRRRHKAVYAEVLKAEAQGIPVRVIAVNSEKFSEYSKTRKMYSIVKDYTDLIFPEIWGCIRSGATANSTINLIGYTMIGTKDMGNGRPESVLIDDDFPEDEDLVVIDPNRIITNRGKIIRSV